MSSYSGYAGSAYNSPAGGSVSSPGGQTIQPGSITYTTTTDANGVVTYHPFRAEPASYRTKDGIVSGIQWVPAEATQVLPAGATMAGPEFAASWNRGSGSHYDAHVMHRQKEEEKRRRKEEKSAAKARERMAADMDLRRAREEDAYTADRRQRRLSGVYGEAGVNSTAFPGSQYGDPRDRRAAEYDDDLDRRFGNMNVGGGPVLPGGGGRERAISGNYGVIPGGPGGPGTRSRRVSISVPGDRPGTGAYDQGPTSAGFYSSATAGGGQYLAGPGGGGAGYAGTGSGYPPPSPRQGDFRAPSPRAGGNFRSASPYRRQSPMPGGPTADGMYPPGHVMEGQPMTRSPYAGAAGMPGGMPLNMRAPSPRPTGAYSQTELMTLTTPDSFSRAATKSASYPPFERMKIQDMDDFQALLPRMPRILTSHDVFESDWDRLMNDLSQAWRGFLRLPTAYPGDRKPKRSSTVSDILDMWNGAFFFARGVELVLYKGREARSGRHAGRFEMRLPRIETESDVSSTSSSENSVSDSENNWSRYGQYGSYGRFEGQERWAAEMREARRYRRQKKAEKKRKAEERRLRRKQREKRYSLWMISTAQLPGQMGGYGSSGMYAGTTGYSGATGYPGSGAGSVMPGAGGYGSAAGYGAQAGGYPSGVGASAYGLSPGGGGGSMYSGGSSAYSTGGRLAPTM